MYKHLYSKFISANPNTLHFAAHSHYYWPDCTREAHLRYWDDSARLADRKWEFLFSEIISAAKRHVADWLNSGQPEQVVFAPNTHEFVCRLLSCFNDASPTKILTTDCEFHSLDRQVKRMEELGTVEVHRVSVEPFDDFETRLIQSVESQAFDLIFVSSIFFKNGLGLKDLRRLIAVAKKNPGTLVIDGYHTFGALPVDFSENAADLFFISGGYKYIQSGEGVCFMHVPSGTELKPANTGWFAEFADLNSRDSNAVGFSNDGMRFAGATFDSSGIYRFNAVMEMFQEQQLNASVINQYVRGLQNRFIENLEQLEHDSSGRLRLSRESLIDSSKLERGHFFAFDLGTHENASSLAKSLTEVDVITDVRDSRIRFGFGLYQDLEDIDRLFERIESLPK